jgi:hypothetical protein
MTVKGPPGNLQNIKWKKYSRNRQRVKRQEEIVLYILQDSSGFKMLERK